MKKLLVTMFDALLMVGCGEKPGGDSPESNQPSAETPDAKEDQVGKIDLGDPETQKIIAAAIEMDKLEGKGEIGENLWYALNQQTPNSGFSARKWSNGQIWMLSQYKDGKRDGLSARWWLNGQKSSEYTYKNGKLVTAFCWKFNGEKCPPHQRRGREWGCGLLHPSRDGR